MNKRLLLGGALAIAVLGSLGGAVAAPASPVCRLPGKIAPARAVGETIIVDHTCTDITAVPQAWIEAAKETLHIEYGRTSHGRQLVTGMSELVAFANGGGLGLLLPQDIFQFSRIGNDDGDSLHLSHGVLDGDAGYFPEWVNETRDYLGTPDPETGRGMNSPETNVIIWAWCGQVSGRTEQAMLDTYLLPMTQLEADYPGVTFVYMTGHADGTGEEGNLHLRNQQIRDYCVENRKVLYDFYDIELYDPDGNYYGDKGVQDDCDYDSDGDGVVDSNWAEEWQTSQTRSVEWYDCYCSHSKPLNCNQKAYAAWWLWARLAGWDRPSLSPDLSSSYKASSPQYADNGKRVVYTVGIRSGKGPLTQTLLLTDTVPTGMVYLPGTLAATSGDIDEGAAPILRWSGVLSPTPAVTVTYAVTVGATAPQAITNEAIIAVPGHQTITRAATVRTNWRGFYLPLVLREYDGGLSS